MVGVSLREKGTIVMNISKLFFHALSNNCSLSSFAACGGVFNFSTGVIKSPAYSYSDYPNNIQCSYTIIGRDDRVLQLKYVRQVFTVGSALFTERIFLCNKEHWFLQGVYKGTSREGEWSSCLVIYKSRKWVSCPPCRPIGFKGKNRHFNSENESFNFPRSKELPITGCKIISLSWEQQENVVFICWALIVHKDL